MAQCTTTRGDRRCSNEAGDKYKTCVRCRERNCASSRRYYRTEAGREARRKQQSKYNHSLKGIMVQHRYKEQKALERIDQHVVEVQHELNI